MKTLKWLFAFTAAVALTAGAACADDYPSRPIRVVVGFAAGGGNDLFARLVMRKFDELTGATSVIENKPGAGGRISSEYVAKQAPDGYTVLVAATGQMAIAAAIFPDLPYHPTKSFIPLNMIAHFPLILVVAADSPAKTAKDLVSLAKASPDKSNYGTSAPPFTIASELMKLKTGMPGVAIPFKGTNESNLCVVSHQCLFTISDGGPAVPLIKGGKTRALAVTGAERSPELPDVPSMAEVGYPEVNIALVERLLRAGRNPGADRGEARKGSRPRAGGCERPGRPEENGGDAGRARRSRFCQGDRYRHREVQGCGEGGQPEISVGRQLSRRAALC